MPKNQHLGTIYQIIFKCYGPKSMKVIYQQQQQQKTKCRLYPPSVLCCITVLFFMCRTVNYYIDLFN